MRFHKAFITSLMAFFALLFSVGCGPKVGETLKHYAPKFEVYRQKFKEIAQTLPPPGSTAPQTASNLNPKPVYASSGNATNTEFISSELLLTPDDELASSGKFDLILESDLMRSIRWTGPKNPMSSTVMDERDRGFSKRLDETISRYRYLVVYRPLTYVKAVAANETTFSPATVDLEVFLIDLNTKAILASVRLQEQSSQEVQYKYKPGDNKMRKLEDWANSSLFSNVRNSLEKKLNEATGGDFKF